MFLLLPLILNNIGASTQAPGLRIVGGHPVSITERPFQVLIFRETPLLTPVCGGAIIHRRWILTAAHCVHPPPATIRAGSDTIIDDSRTQWYDVVKAISHQRFDTSEWAVTHDIGLLMTDRTIEFGPTVQAIGVTTKSPRPSAKAVVSGFGVTVENSKVFSHVLKEVSVTVLDRTYCTKLLASITRTPSLSETHFCAAYLEGGRDACQGDSGGPLTIGNSLVGVVSWGIGCAHRMVPAFYTDVAQFVPWIDETISEY